jgi:hypothetical protein
MFRAGETNNIELSISMLDVTNTDTSPNRGMSSPAPSTLPQGQSLNNMKPSLIKKL